MGDFCMPSLGADMDAGTLVEWRKKPGEPVARGEVVALVETEKGTIEVECWEAGTFEDVVVQPGAKVPVGTVLAHIAGAGTVAAPKPVANEPPPERLRVSPAARKLAEGLGVDLAQVHGTGPNGAIQREDVEAFAKGRAPAQPADRFALMRRAIAAAVARSQREIPHYFLGSELELEPCLRALEAENARRPASERLLPVVPILRAVIRAALEVPGFNGTFDDGAFHKSETVTLGLAISVKPAGLVIAAVPEAERLSAIELARRVDETVGRARGGALRSSDLAPATLTVSNLGDRGAEMVYGLIFPPQVALVGVGRIVARPTIVEGDRVEPRRSAWFSLAADHRVTDGHQGSLFLAAVARHLQTLELP